MVTTSLVPCNLVRRARWTWTSTWTKPSTTFAAPSPAHTERVGARNWRRTLTLTVPGIVWALLPAALVAALPWLVALVTGRVFTRHQLFRAVPSIEIWWIAAGILGLALGTARIVVLLRFHRLASTDDE